MGFQPARPKSPATSTGSTGFSRDHHGDHALRAGAARWVIVRFNRRANPTPARFTHNTPIEVAWTVIPIVILVFIGAFSLPVLFKQLEIPEAT
jgi:hypothetical protein